MRQPLAVPVNAEIAVSPCQSGDETGFAPDGLGVQLPVSSGQTAAVILGTAVVGADALRDTGGDGVGGHVPAGEPAEQGLNKQFCDKVGRHGMPRQTHNGLFPGLSQNGGLPRLDGNAVEQKPPHRFDNPAGGVLHAHTAAAGQQHRVAFRNRFGDFFRQKGFVVDDDAVVIYITSEGGEHGFQHRTVHVPHLPRAGLHLRRYQLVSRGNHANGQFFLDINLYLSDGSQGSNIRAGQHPALSQNHLAGIHVIPPEDHVHARCGRFGNADGTIAVVLGVFDHHHAVGVPGHRTAGGDGDTLSCIQGKIRALAHEHCGLQRQNRGNGIAASKGIAGPDGKAVHRGAVKIRHIFPCRHILRQNPPHGVRKGNHFRPLQRREFRFNHRQNLFRRLYIQHIRPP